MFPELTGFITDMTGRAQRLCSLLNPESFGEFDFLAFLCKINYLLLQNYLISLEFK